MPLCKLSVRILLANTGKASTCCTERRKTNWKEREIAIMNVSVDREGGAKSNESLEISVLQYMF